MLVSYFLPNILLLTIIQIRPNTADRRPNILLILADDLGYADLDWKDPYLLTPNLRALALSNHSTYLLNSYVHSLCTPTRSALMTGLYSFHTGTQNSVFLPAEPSGVLAANLTFLPEALKHLGYSTHLVGKWHLGYCRREFLPTARGFDTFYGFYGAQEGYFNHSLDHFDSRAGVLMRGLDLFREDQSNGASEPDFTKNGVYSADLFAAETQHLLQQQRSRAVDLKPFFIFLSFQSVHAPLQAKEEDIRRCRAHHPLHTAKRLAYCALLLAMDDAIGRVVATLKKLDLYHNTMLVFSSDNGGDSLYGASNYPLRGGKSSPWEGGTKTTTFFHSPRFIQQFSERTELFHVVDMYATLLAIASPHQKYSRAYRDGINQWPMISSGGKLETEKIWHERTEFVYNVDTYSSAIRWMDYKLIYETSIPQLLATRGGRAKLFRLSDDPLEQMDISRQHPHLVRRLIDRILSYQQETVPSVHKSIDPRGYPSRHNGVYASGWC